MTESISRETLLSPERHLFLSPHYDDIALSCGGTASLITGGGRSAEILLIFGDHPDPAAPLTSFAESLHEQWGMSAAEVIAGRRSEETVASSILGAEDRYLPFRDAIYRGDLYTGDPMLFGPIHAAEEGLAAEVAAALALPSEPDGSIRLYAPLAIGFHVDHQHAFRTGVLLAQAGWDVWFYEDLPYALIPGRVEDRLERIESPVSVLGAIDVSSVWSKKIDAIMAYPSQLGVIFGGYVGVGSDRVAIDEAMRAYSRRVGEGTLAERFWHVSP